MKTVLHGYSWTALALVLGTSALPARAAQVGSSDGQVAEPAAPALPVPATQAGPGAGQVAEPAAPSEIIVTGTRTNGATVAESAAPIKVLNPEMMQHVGQPSLDQVLTQLIPSFNITPFGTDTAQLTVSARLRGLSPNHTLVLINGKRRHGTANLNVAGGLAQGGAAPDLDFIPPSSIARIEILEDGAAAQYGSDAIAGVINIILKDKADGGAVSATAGQNYRGDGEIYSGSANIGTKLGAAGWLNLTGMYRFHAHSQIGGIDERLSQSDGALRTDLSPEQAALYKAISGYPYVNRVIGDPESKLYSGSYDAGYDFGNLQLYSFGTYGHRTASANENYRTPDRVIASPILGERGTLTTPGEILFAPQGFHPKEAFREDDFSTTIGFKGDAAGWNFDLSATYGRDRDRIYTRDSANASLFVDTHFTPTDFYDGAFTNSEWTVNADAKRDFDIGLAGPVNVAIGAAYLYNKYEIQNGDAASIYKEGGQSFPGFQPTDAGRHARDNEAVYLDLALEPIDRLKLDAAIRYEHYSDFGSKVIEKLTGRYDVSPALAFRGTVSTGFRAPTLAEEYYSSTNVAPSYAIVQLPANSAAAKLLGFENLKPETSTNYSFGTVLKPLPRLTLTIDAYQISIRNRIVSTGTLFGVGGAENSAAVVAAIAAHGNIVDPTASQVGVATFTNGINTRTRGVDVVATYVTPLGKLGRINWTLSGNYNVNKLTKQIGSTVQLADNANPAVRQPLFDQTAISTLEDSSPKYKIIMSALWKFDRFLVTMRETIYGKSSIDYSPDGGIYYRNTVGTAGITDFELSYEIAKGLRFSAGANNLFDKRPPSTVVVPGGGATPILSTPFNVVYNSPSLFSPYGINGGYYYARMDFSW